ncbi:hypothetical protein A8C00_16075 [Acinetobacter baumannii]|nr:hypothetical protein A8C00_16075 [Acinetobacter baumannii]
MAVDCLFKAKASSSTHRARTLTGTMTQDEGQERQEAKTQDCQEDKRPETLVKGNGNNMECSRLREKQGVLIANRDGGTR